MSDKEKEPYRVLSIDGGGMRGLYSASLLDTLARRFSSKLLGSPNIGASFDLICGTSTGGILATALAAEVPIENIKKLYIDNGEEIFPSPRPDGKGEYKWAFKHKRTPSANAEKLKAVLKESFKDETLGELFERTKIGICLPSVDFKTHRARVFKTAHDPQKDMDDKYKLIDICMATSAAPIIFPMAGVNDPGDENLVDTFVDGGLWANNPVLVALTEALHIADPEQAIEILSIGTCDPPQGTLATDDMNRGIIDWGFGIGALNLSLEAQSSGHAYTANLLANSLRKLNKEVSICRIHEDPLKPEDYNSIGLDRADKSATDVLLQAGRNTGRSIHGLCLREDETYMMVQKMFSNLTVL